VKKLIAIVIALIAVLAMTVPAMADDPAPPATPIGVGTGVGISGGSGEEPVIKCKWESSTIAGNDETGDATHLVSGPQIYPPVSFQGEVPIYFWIVANDNPLEDISVVYVDVFHPEGYPEQKSWKFQVILQPWDSANLSAITGPQASAAIDKFNAALANGLVTFNDGYTATDVTSEIAQGEAYLWYGYYTMYYHQPWGHYKVVGGALDAGPIALPESVLFNWFDYVPVTAMELDFTGINYGSVTTEGDVSGDNHFGGDQPTLRNIGNTWLTVQIQQDDMGFGKDSGTGTWNVQFDARIGSITTYPSGGDGSETVYDPAGFATMSAPDPAKWTDLPGVVHLCNTWKIDFSIHIVKAIWPSYSGMMWLRAIYSPFTGPNISHPDSGVDGT
jgi:hypothetical protein